MAEENDCCLQQKLVKQGHGHMTVAETLWQSGEAHDRSALLACGPTSKIVLGYAPNMVAHDWPCPWHATGWFTNVHRDVPVMDDKFRHQPLRFHKLS